MFPLHVAYDVFSVFSNFHAYVKTRFNHNIQNFQCDNDREFNNQLLLTFFCQMALKLGFLVLTLHKKSKKLCMMYNLSTKSFKPFRFKHLFHQNFGRKLS